MVFLLALALVLVSVGLASQWFRARKFEDDYGQQTANACRLVELLLFERAVAQGAEPERAKKYAREFVRYKPPDFVIAVALGEVDDG
jgi:hypothetical protein